jgi:acetyl esterase/lipase
MFIETATIPVGKLENHHSVTLKGMILEQSPELPHNHKRPAVIICPGGGYGFRSDREGEPVAARFLAAGMHAFLLEYSVAPARWPVAALELASAVRWVRQNAPRLGVLPDQVYIIGFSAGGHLCASLGVKWEDRVFKDALGEDALAWRPDGMILCYPVISFLEHGHQGSRINLLGEDSTREQAQALSLELQVKHNAVPAFLWHTATDGAVPVENALMLAAALRKHKVPFELHVYERGLHGLSLCDETTAREKTLIQPDVAGWFELCLNWLKRRQPTKDWY